MKGKKIYYLWRNPVLKIYFPRSMWPIAIISKDSSSAVLREPLFVGKRRKTNLQMVTNIKVRTALSGITALDQVGYILILRTVAYIYIPCEPIDNEILFYISDIFPEGHPVMFLNRNPFEEAPI